MGNRKQNEVLDTIVDCLIINNPITRSQLSELAGLSFVTIKRWVDLILKIQAMPKLVFENKKLYFDIRPAEDVLMENAIALLEEEVVFDDFEEDFPLAMDDD